MNTKQRVEEYLREVDGAEEPGIEAFTRSALDVLLHSEVDRLSRDQLERLADVLMYCLIADDTEEDS